jgi:hypothetical protein
VSITEGSTDLATRCAFTNSGSSWISLTSKDLPAEEGLWWLVAKEGAIRDEEMY